jgi:hypothetical protein
MQNHRNMVNAYYSDSIKGFLKAPREQILGAMSEALPYSLETTQKHAWIEQIRVLKDSLVNVNGRIYLEYGIPRMGKRIDALVIIGPVIFVIEFKVGETRFTRAGQDQVCDYCLDLKNFHDSSHDAFIAPILVPTGSHQGRHSEIRTVPQNRKLFEPIKSTVKHLSIVIEKVLERTFSEAHINCQEWERGRYCPSPTIIQAALELYNHHSVDEITRHEAQKTDITKTSKTIDEIIIDSRKRNIKSICFVTGVPGAGKTLVGLNVATKHHRVEDKLHSVFLSGNGPLVAVLREALARDHVQNEKEQGRKIRKGEAHSKVRAFIQNVHHFRDTCLDQADEPPIEHVALFDEAQRAWDLKQTAKFMSSGRRRERVRNFKQSEPEFLISCLDRHRDWAVIVCLVGGGQEIHTGEAGIVEWIRVLKTSFPKWHIHISSRLADSEYGAGSILGQIKQRPNVTIRDSLHLAVSMRTFRAENVSKLVKELLDLNVKKARSTLGELREKYPILITRDLAKAKRWLRETAIWSERYGIVVSSHAERLKPHAIDVKRKVNPIHWFLNDRTDVRSSFYLEDVATEFHIQGLELDWVCVTWDADFRHTKAGWQHRSFRGKGWNQIKKSDRQIYQKNAYRVLLTRARQGMVICVPPGDPNDPTRKPEFYDPTFEYLAQVGFSVI